MSEYRKYLKPSNFSTWGLEFELKNLRGQLMWLDNKLTKVKGEKEKRDITRQINEKVWSILLLELNLEKEE